MYKEDNEDQHVYFLRRVEGFRLGANKVILKPFYKFRIYILSEVNLTPLPPFMNCRIFLFFPPFNYSYLLLDKNDQVWKEMKKEGSIIRQKSNFPSKY